MRSVLCAAALVVLGSPTLGERIRIEGVIANYDTASDTFTFEVHFDRPFILGEDYLSIWSDFPHSPRLGIQNGSPSQPAFSFEDVRYNIVGGSWNLIDGSRRQVAPVVSGDMLRLSANAASRSFDPQAIQQPMMIHLRVLDYFGSNAYGTQLIPYYDTWSSWSSIDDPRFLYPVPEPSSLAIALCGVALLGLLWPPCANLRFRLRHVRNP